jgi:hypothetical protein
VEAKKASSGKWKRRIRAAMTFTAGGILGVTVSSRPCEMLLIDMVAIGIVIFTAEWFDYGGDLE